MAKFLLYLLFFLMFQQMLISEATSPFSSTDSLPRRSHKVECVALMEFRGNFSFENGSRRLSRNLGLWKLEGESGNCCAWDGVVCDARNGHVIALDLSLCKLEGFINSASSLFRLVHLQKLNLAFNNFRYSRIPSAIGNLSRLTTLNLSFCGFKGQVPSQISGLTNLSSLDLSSDTDGLEIKKHNLNSLIKNLTKLEFLHLAYANIASPLPVLLSNSSSLKSLVISNCNLEGEFPVEIFKLPNLKVIDISGNGQLSGYLPEFHAASSPLEVLSLNGANFYGELPLTLGNLGSLSVLDVGFCTFRGLIPCSASNLTPLSKLVLSNNEFHGPITSLANMTRLTVLDLFTNKFQGPIHSIASMTHLTDLYLSYNEFDGDLPFLGSHVHLQILDLRFNRLTGQMRPFQLGNLSALKYLWLRSNQLTGPAPSHSQLGNLTLLSELDLSFNMIRDTVPLDMFLQLKNLVSLDLSFNDLSVIDEPNDDVAANCSSQLRKIALASCNMVGFPKALLNLDELWELDLSSNQIHGTIPMWFLNVSAEQLVYLNLSRNHLTGFSKIYIPVVFRWPTLLTLDLSFNDLKGPLPIPPKSVSNYFASNNALFGEIPRGMCNCKSIVALDLSKNNLTGSIPTCFGSLSQSLRIVNLRDNSIYGRIPRFLPGKCSLSMIDLSDNRLQGRLPRSFSGCTDLVMLNLGGNSLRDTFPSWLGSLPQLAVLVLRSNKFYGAIREPKSDQEEFPALHIVDLSQNDLGSHLPSESFRSWDSMRASNVDQADYIGTFIEVGSTTYDDGYEYRMEITNKGITMEYPKILSNFIVIDFSGNNFSGKIPDSIASLKGLHLLNLSNNLLDGTIPPSLGALTNLEALDLSRNNLSGEIPQQLTQLIFLEVFNVSDNRLSGAIPRGKQFNTFETNSYGGNDGLCGDPLSKKYCGKLEAAPPRQSRSEDKKVEDSSQIEWKAVAAGYASGFIVAAMFGHWMIKRKAKLSR